MHETPSGRFIKLPRKEYAELTAKAKAHDQYLAATKKMRMRQAITMVRRDDLADAYAVPDDERYEMGWNNGFLDCLREFGEAVVNAGMEDAPFE